MLDYTLAEVRERCDIDATDDEYVAGIFKFLDKMSNIYERGRAMEDMEFGHMMGGIVEETGLSFEDIECMSENNAKSITIFYWLTAEEEHEKRRSSENVA